MNQKINELEINGVVYVPKNETQNCMAEKLDGLEYCIVRTCSAGVFAGYLKERIGQEGTVLNARMLWYWDGAASLNQLAIDGVARPQNCKFPEAVEKVILTQIIEIIPCTEKAKKSIASVEIWKI